MTDSVLITGSATGLGKATALHLAERGYRVYATVPDLEMAPDLQAAAEQRAVRLRVLRLDVTDRASIEAAIATVIDESGALYAVINNASIGLRGYFEDLTDDDIRGVFDVNVLGVMSVTRGALPHMRRAGRGRIVLISSVGGRVGSLVVSAYCASKFALEGFGESLALEVGPLGIDVILIEPSIVNTERWTTNRGVATGAQDPRSPYYAWFQQAEKETDRLVRASTISSRDVAMTVYRALTVRRPRLRYMVGRNGRLVVSLRRWIPGDLFERLYFGIVVRRVTRPRRGFTPPSRRRAAHRKESCDIW